MDRGLANRLACKLDYWLLLAVHIILVCIAFSKVIVNATILSMMCSRKGHQVGGVDTDSSLIYLSFILLSDALSKQRTVKETPPVSSDRQQLPSPIKPTQN